MAITLTTQPAERLHAGDVFTLDGANALIVGTVAITNAQMLLTVTDATGAEGPLRLAKKATVHVIESKARYAA